MKNLIIFGLFLVVFLGIGKKSSGQTSGGGSDWIVGVVSSIGAKTETTTTKTTENVKKPEEYTNDDIKEIKAINNADGTKSDIITFNDGGKQEIITSDTWAETITTSSDGLSRLSVLKNKDGSTMETKTTLEVGKKQILITTTVSGKDASGKEIATNTKTLTVPR